VSWTVWLTGPPAAGKTTVARALLTRLAVRGVRPVWLESDALRRVLTPEPTYEPAERDEFYRAVADLAALLVAQGHPVLVDAVAPRRRHRDRARRAIPRFLEVHVTAPRAVREGRDPKGLYRLAREGRAPNLPGSTGAYEEPPSPELALSGQDSVESNALAVERLLDERGFLTKAPPSKP
jgi:adenylylsulfate kinase-like enzyme